MIVKRLNLSFPVGVPNNNLSHDILIISYLFNLCTKMILQELSIQIPNKYIEFVEKLNSDQMIAFNTIMNVINHKERVVFC